MASDECIMCTVGPESSLQHVYTCSEMRYCKHREQSAWRCGIPQQVNQHTFLDPS